MRARLRFTIYCYTSRITGKKYVGQTKVTREKRWAWHLQKVNQSIFAAAIREQPVDAWQYRILDVATTRRGAYLAEALWIDRLGTLAPHGYNGNKGNAFAATGRVPEDAARYVKWIKCGKAGCLGCPHGPYVYAKWDEHGKTMNAYLGKV